MPIKINGSTSGSTTITAPATGSDESIELSTALAAKAPSASPTFTGTVALPTTTTINGVSGFGGWTAWTPALTASTTNPTLGTGSTATGEYTQIGKLVIATFQITFGTSGVNAGSGDYRVSLPIAGKTNNRNLNGTLQINDNNANIIRAAFPLFWVTSTSISIRIDSTSGGGYTITNAAPWTWAASDYIFGTVSYEAA